MPEKGRPEGSGLIDPLIVKELRKSLKGLKPVVRERKPTMSKQIVLISILPEIEEAKQKGYTNKQITEVLKERGLDISLSTLVVALRKGKQQSKQVETGDENSGQD